MYDIEVVDVDREEKRVKFTTSGNRGQYDEWRPHANEEQYFPFIRTRSWLFLLPNNWKNDNKLPWPSTVYREIKKKLWSWRRENPDICVDLNTDQDVFEAGLGSVVPGLMYRGEMVYNPRNNRLLDCILSQKWVERILNQNVDFAYVVDGTVRLARAEELNC